MGISIEKRHYYLYAHINNYDADAVAEPSNFIAIVKVKKILTMLDTKGYIVVDVIMSIANDWGWSNSELWLRSTGFIKEVTKEENPEYWL